MYRANIQQYRRVIGSKRSIRIEFIEDGVKNVFQTNWIARNKTISIVNRRNFKARIGVSATMRKVENIMPIFTGGLKTFIVETTH